MQPTTPTGSRTSTSGPSRVSNSYCSMLSAMFAKVDAGSLACM